MSDYGEEKKKESPDQDEIIEEKKPEKKDVLDETKDFVIELHGKANFDVVYSIMNKYVR